MADSRRLNGRSAIYTDAEGVDQSNVKDVLEDARPKHDENAGDISYLYDYYRGVQPILNREKVYNTEICNRVVENRAKEISDFKTGYLLSSPIQYIDAAANDSEEEVENSDLNRLNQWMRSEAKEASDLEVAFWQSVCGTAFRMLDPKDQAPEDETEAPFRVMVLDPRYTFVVYSSAPSHEPLLGVTYVEDDDGNRTYYAYTATQAFVVDNDGNVVSTVTHQLGRVPIIEYPHGPTRMGDFEPVVPLLDAIDTAQSSRLDAVDQFSQAILVMESVDTGDLPTFMMGLRENGGLTLPEGAKAYYLTLDMDQGQTQTLVDNLYDAALKVCGMPNPKSGYNTSDTGAAVILRDGWSATEAVACRTETWFKRSERRFLDMAIDFCDVTGGLSLAHADVDIRFPRRNYTNDTSNVDNLIKMLSSEWIRPEFAYEHSNLTPDPHAEWLLARKWHESQEDAAVDEAMSSDEDGNPEVADGEAQVNAMGATATAGDAA